MKQKGEINIQNPEPDRKVGYLIRIFSLPFFLIMFLSCIDEYWPEISDYQNLLVVDGMINNGPGPFMVNLSLSTRVDIPEYQPYSGCEVVIIDDEGGSIPLIESDEGTYLSAGEGEKGIVGRSYKLLITTPSGKQYASDFEELLAPAAIDSLYAVVETKSSPDYNHNLNGCQFYINTRSDSDKTTHYLWKLEHTYEYTADYFIHYIFAGSPEPFYPVDSLYTCWLSEKVNKIYVYGTAGLTSSDLERFPLNYVSTESRRLSVRYSLLVDQLTVGESTYRFWNDVREQNSGESSLYTQQLYQIRGNVRNISDDLEPVLGYFTVAGKDSERIFVNRPEDIEFYYPVCVVNEGAYDAYSYIYWTDKRTWPLYVYRDPDGGRALMPQACVDCRESGGTVNKPEFWIDP